MAHGRSDFWEVAYVLREVVKYFTKSGRNVGSTTWKLEKNRKSLWNWRIRKWQKRNGHFWWITVIDKKTYLVNKKILVEIIAPTRIMAQLELRPTSELRVFIIARAINWDFTVFVLSNLPSSASRLVQPSQTTQYLCDLVPSATAELPNHPLCILRQERPVQQREGTHPGATPVKKIEIIVGLLDRIEMSKCTLWILCCQSNRMIPALANMIAS